MGNEGSPKVLKLPYSKFICYSFRKYPYLPEHSISVFWEVLKINLRCRKVHFSTRNLANMLLSEAQIRHL